MIGQTNVEITTLYIDVVSCKKKKDRVKMKPNEKVVGQSRGRK